MRIGSSIGLLSALAMSIGVLGFPVAGRAVTLPTLNLVQTSDHCTNNCNSGATALPFSGNSVTVVQTTAGTASVAGVLDITATLASGWNFLHTGNSGDVNFAFALLNIPAVTFTPLTPAAFSTTGWEPIGTTTGSGTGATLITGNTSGLGTIGGVTAGNAGAPGQAGQAGYGLMWLNGNGSSKEFSGQTVHFTISALNLTLASLVATGDFGSYFYIDVGSDRTFGGDRVTGLIDFGVSQVPLPPAALLFGSALAGLGILGRRRRKSTVAIAAT